MRKIMIASHGKTASGIVSTIELFMGKQDIECIDAYMEGPEETYVERITSFVHELTIDDEAYLFTDLPGGSVHQLIIKEISKQLPKHIVVITNVNIAIVIELLTNPEFKSYEEINHMIMETNLMPIALNPYHLFEEEISILNDDEFLD